MYRESARACGEQADHSTEEVIFQLNFKGRVGVCQSKKTILEQSSRKAFWRLLLMPC